jgi:hypothetical protein
MPASHLVRRSRTSRANSWRWRTAAAMTSRNRASGVPLICASHRLRDLAAEGLHRFRLLCRAPMASLVCCMSAGAVQGTRRRHPLPLPPRCCPQHDHLLLGGSVSGIPRPTPQPWPSFRRRGRAPAPPPAAAAHPARHPHQERPAPPARLRPAAYRRRNRVERLINRLKQFRRIATRYEKRAANYLAMVSVGMILLWPRTPCRSALVMSSCCAGNGARPRSSGRRGQGGTHRRQRGGIGSS